MVVLGSPLSTLGCLKEVKTMRIMKIVAVMVIALATFAPAFAQGTTNGIGPCPVGGLPTVACPVINDDVIQATIASRLGGLIPNAGSYIYVSSCQGVVTLTGMVFNDRQRQVAGILASSVRGVMRVDNRLAVSPMGDADMRLMAAIQAKLDDLVIGSHQFMLEVNQGVVQITGWVDSELALDMVPIAIQSVPGVTAVYNNLIIRGSQSQVGTF